MCTLHIVAKSLSTPLAKRRTGAERRLAADDFTVWRCPDPIVAKKAVATKRPDNDMKCILHAMLQHSYSERPSAARGRPGDGPGTNGPDGYQIGGCILVRNRSKIDCGSEGFVGTLWFQAQWCADSGLD